MQAQFNIELEQQVVPLAVADPTGAPVRRKRSQTRVRQVDAALRNALWQWMLFTGVIGVSLLALVLSLKA